jgi:hypothetical protein
MQGAFGIAALWLVVWGAHGKGAAGYQNHVEAQVIAQLFGKVAGLFSFAAKHKVGHYAKKNFMPPS